MPKRSDRNQAAIVAALREIPGISVQDLHEVGKGCPDIMAAYHYVNYLFEIKMPGAKLTGCEPVWHAAWRGQVAVIYSAEDALRIMGVIE